MNENQIAFFLALIVWLGFCALLYTALVTQQGILLTADILTQIVCVPSAVKRIAYDNNQALQAKFLGNLLLLASYL